MTTDHYKTLGLLPGAEDAVIRAAYRALMRIYHPDANSSPEAQDRARAIAAAYAVLGDPVARAEYDDEIGLITSQDPGDFAEPARAKPLRAAGIASIAVAIASVFLLFSWERPEQVAKTSSGGDRVQALVRPEEAALLPPSETVVRPSEPLLDEQIPQAVDNDPMLQPPPPIAEAEAKASRPPQAQPSAERPKARSMALARRTAPASAKAIAPHAPDQLSKVEVIATGFFDQSWAHANEAKQKLLLASRDRSVASRRLCRTDQCETEAYLRHMRETSAIMEGRPLPAQ